MTSEAMHNSTHADICNRGIAVGKHSPGSFQISHGRTDAPPKTRLYSKGGTRRSLKTERVATGSIDEMAAPGCDVRCVEVR